MRNRELAVAIALGLGLVACGGASNSGQEAEPAAEAPPAQEAAPAPETAPLASEAESAAEPGFDIANVPVSEVELGEFPYLRLPAGYVHTDRINSDYDRIAFWTGNGLEWVEGRVFGSRVRGDEDQGKTFSLLEYRRNMQAAIQQAGGERIAEGQWSRAARDEMKDTDDNIGVRYNGVIGDIWNRPVETYVIRRPDRSIWIQITGSAHDGSILMAETAPLQITARAQDEFPWITLPEGYVYTDRKNGDYDRIAFWTGKGLEWVEGRVFGARVRGDEDRGKTFALLEYRRNLQAAIQQAGGERIAEGRWPREARDELKNTDGNISVRYNGAIGDIWNRPVETYAIHRPDRSIWIQVTGDASAGSLLIAETAPLEITAGLLEAEVLKQQLDAGGRVAIEVNFAVDKADILPDSRPQIDQVLALLRDDPALRLSIDGHTDNTGDAAHNQRLSEARAQAVVAALVAQGIDASRLEAWGHGQSQPVADNATDEGRAKNRRVELVRLG